MGSYRVSVRASAERELRAVPKTHLRLLMEKVKRLAEDPRPHQCEKLSGEDRYRIRQGDWRVVYSVDDTLKQVVVVKVGHRREVYR
ncbi:MAG: type II toxin-antitoxin system RelE/ParE family toxin [Elusimicrobia bacterium]|nr:type II toxin-antitoxin system RelE/ParE family toxin [Elusimicrobiota bacterium]